MAAENTNKRKLNGVDTEIAWMRKRPRRAIRCGVDCLNVLLGDGVVPRHRSMTMGERLKANPYGVERCKTFYFVQGIWLVRELVLRSNSLAEVHDVVLGYLFPTWDLAVAQACVGVDGRVGYSNMVPYNWGADYKSILREVAFFYGGSPTDSRETAARLTEFNTFENLMGADDTGAWEDEEAEDDMLGDDTVDQLYSLLINNLLC